MRVLVLCLITLVLSHCTQTATLVVATNPPDATISDINGLALGDGTVQIRIDSSVLLQSTNEYGCFLIDGFEASWPDASVVEVPELALCGSVNGEYLVRIFRPQEVPNLVLGTQRVSETIRAGGSGAGSRTILYRSNNGSTLRADKWYDEIDNIQTESDRLESRRNADPDDPHFPHNRNYHSFYPAWDD